MPQGRLDVAGRDHVGMTGLRNRSEVAAGFDGVAITGLAAGHLVVDLCTGVLPALLPLFVEQFSLSDLQATMILGASLLASSAIQPIFGIVADRRGAPWLRWGGVAVGSAGVAAAGLAGSYLAVLACVIISGLGIAAYHPEAARVANQASAGRPATGLAWFMLGGNLGFSLGPLLVGVAAPFIGLRATLFVLVPGLIVTAWLRLLSARVALPTHTSTGVGPRPVSNVAGVVILLVVTTLRTWTFFVMLALVPLLLSRQRGLSDALTSLSVFLFTAGATIGTLLGAQLAERIGSRRMLMWTMPVATPLVVAVVLLPVGPAVAVVGLCGGVLMASFSVTVALGQRYMPSRLALAAGLLIGFGAIGSAPPGLALFGAFADAAGRETALLWLAALPALGGLIAYLLPEPVEAR